MIAREAEKCKCSGIGYRVIDRKLLNFQQFPDASASVSDSQRNRSSTRILSFVIIDLQHRNSRYLRAMKEKRARHDAHVRSLSAVFFDRVTDERDNESAINTLLDVSQPTR